MKRGVPATGAVAKKKGNQMWNGWCCRLWSNQLQGQEYLSLRARAFLRKGGDRGGLAQGTWVVKQRAVVNR